MFDPVLLNPICRAEDAISRLDERLRVSPLRQGVLNRLAYEDARAAIWNQGDILWMEALLLRDHDADVNVPTHELERAMDVLRTSRRALDRAPEQILTLAGLRALVGSWQPREVEKPPTPPVGLSQSVLDLIAFTEALEKQADLPAGRSEPRIEKDAPPETDAAFDLWTQKLRDVQTLPSTLGAAELIQEWDRIDPIPRKTWVGRLMAQSYLRCGRVSIPLPLNLGQKRHRQASPRRRPVEDLSQILAQIELAAKEGMAVHDRLTTVAAILERRLANRRRTSRMDGLVRLLLDQPMVTSGMVVETLGITERSAISLLTEIAPSVREITGRNRYRAWSAAL